MRAIGYYRVSTAEQAQRGHGLAEQPQRIKAWCLARGLDLVDVIADEGVSAGKPLDKRPGGAALLQRMRAGDADVVVVYALDRLFRDAQHGLNVLRGMPGQAPLPVQSVTEPLDTTTAFGRFIVTVWLANGELERDRTRERTTAVSQGLRRRGRKYGHVPYGLVARGGRMDEDAGRIVDQRLYLDPATWPTRCRIVAMKRDGGLSLEAISASLRRGGFAAPNGGAVWSKSTLAELIKHHDSLAHLPMLQPQGETPVTDSPDAPVSTGEGGHAL